MLNELTVVISTQLNVNMHKLTVECNDGIFECNIQLFAHDTSEVDTLISELKKVPDVNQVIRI